MRELNFNGFDKNVRIVLNPLLTDGYTNEPVRRHKRKRIQKKWIKRYGYKQKASPNIFFTADGIAIMHPDMFRKFVKEFGTEEGAAFAINNYFAGGKKA